ncbi:hypothetical protein TNCV_3921191 [Trichonephila clavipes]|nr:hypothetical protein TNCV_3921191 [Trichonephila clavipes]
MACHHSKPHFATLDNAAWRNSNSDASNKKLDTGERHMSSFQTKSQFCVQYSGWSRMGVPYSPSLPEALYQQDNARQYVSHLVPNYVNMQGIRLLSCPAWFPESVAH